jgi:hypothetical protein
MPSTDNAVISRNVAANVFGHCFYLEDGTEQGNEISYNLAAGIKIMGDVSRASIADLAAADQSGFTLYESPDFANPADRAAAGFYIPNGNNFVFGNAASGGFAGYSFPNFPAAFDGGGSGIEPMEEPISFFDGNTAHSSAYFWPDAGCVYVGGVLESVDVGGEPTLRYLSGRSLGDRLRNGADTFTNTKTFLCASGIVHWGKEAHVINLEAWDVGFMAQLFGSASIQSAIAAGHTGHTDYLCQPDTSLCRPPNYYQRGFRFYDTDTRTNMRGIVFRGFHPDPNAGSRLSQDSCAMISTSHSDEFTPQRMTATAEFYFADVDDSQRFCHDDSGTLSSRNFNINDMDGSVSFVEGDGIPAGPRIVGSGHTDIWWSDDDCVHNSDWGLWICPQTGTRNVASIATHPNRDVHVTMYELDGRTLGENWYSSTEFEVAQITGPSETEWHHVFPGGVPPSFEIHPKQVPESSFVVYSFPLPLGQSCSISETGWSEVSDFAALLASSDSVFANDSGICFIRIPPADRGTFDAAGLSTPIQTWRTYPEWTSFIVDVGP